MGGGIQLKKTYTVKPYRVILNVFFGLLGASVITFFASLFLDGIYPYAIGAVIFLLFLWLVVFDNILTVHIDGDKFIVKKGKKSKTYVISECSFRGVMKNARRSDSSYTLFVITPKGEERVDCELLGRRQYLDILEELGVMGDKAVPTKVETTREE